MKTTLRSRALCIVVFFLGVSSVVTSQTTDAAQSSPTVSVVMQFVEAINSGDRDAALALVSDDACIGYGGSCLSHTRLDSWWSTDIFDVAGRIEEYELAEDGDDVRLAGRFRSTGWNGQANYYFTVRDGLIVAWDLR